VTTGGTGSGTGGAGTGGGNTTPPAGVPLTLLDGWVDGGGNTLGVQGAVFHFADPTTTAGPPALAAVATGAQYCISGEAAKVDLMCTITAEDMALGASDCYGKFWGAAIGFNLNQPTVPDPADPTKMIGGDPVGFDATAIKGFGFELSGAKVPPSLRFKIDMGGSEEWCTGSETVLAVGSNQVTFDKLFQQCWQPAAMRGPGVDATTQAGIVKISWQLPTNDKGTIPFDYCVSNIVALQ
jgi:hypothetical protein